MAHLYRFLGTLNDEGSWDLDAGEAAHLKNVLRLKVGDPCEVMDGKGKWAAGKIISISGKSASIESIEISSEEENKQKITLALGVLKAGSLDDLLPCITELGIDRIELFLQAETAKNRISEKMQQRWERIVLQSVKQCKRSYIPEIIVFNSFEEWLSSAKQSLATKIVLDPHASDTLSKVCESSDASPLLLAVGGEKGFTDSEMAALSELSFDGAAIGSNILRAYTAAIAAVSTATQWRHQFSGS
jgi:16S rRNA (uracil1498-N3)-methyltransferase